MTCTSSLIFLLLGKHAIPYYILRLSSTIRWIRNLMGSFWTFTGMGSTNPVIYDSADDIRSVPSTHFLAPRSVHCISDSSGIITIPFCTSHNILYYTSLLRSFLKTSPISAMITICLFQVWFLGRVFRTMSMLVVDGGRAIVRFICSFFNLSDIEISQYVHINKLMTERIWYAYPGFLQG